MDIPKMDSGTLSLKLRELLRTAPPAYQRWDSEAVKRYKKCCAQASSLLDRRSTSVPLLAKALADQQGFWRSE